MYLGNIMEIGPTEELFENPSNPYTHALLSAIPRPDPTDDRERITLRGTPPSPRDPPTGCPFSTRCPVKIRPEEYRDVEGEVWQRIETFREVIRARTRAEQSLTTRVKELVGIETRRQGMDAIVEELFGDLDVPRRVRTHVGEAAELASNGKEDEARTYLREEFGSVCDHEHPDDYTVSSSGRTSLCHRHDEEVTVEEPATAFRHRSNARPNPQD
jgi:peptide/nickel transport system ATP-binding protein